MKSRIVRIGNSRGVRIPKSLLEQTGLDGEVDISVRGDGLMSRPVRKARDGWEAAFGEMARRGDDKLRDDAPPSLSSWDEENWEWR
jgi:antitoxin MazE